MPRSNWPAVPKTSIRGLRFFSHQPGYGGALPKPESYAHTRLKIDIVKTARSLGFQADIEVTGGTPDGEEWIADILVTKKNGKRAVYEVQLSGQHLKDFRFRTEKYRRSSVEVVWVVSEDPVASRLAKALGHENHAYYLKHGKLQCEDKDLITFGVRLPNKDTYPEKSPLLRFGQGKEVRFLALPDAVQGSLSGAPLWRQSEWCWRDKQNIDN